MNYFQSIILGIIQGITEFLPISSSGHLALVQNLFGISEGNMFFTVILHFATLLSVITVFYKDIYRIIKSFVKYFYNVIFNHSESIDDDAKLGLLILVGIIPTGIIGILFEDYFEKLYSMIWFIGLSFIITGFILKFSSKIANKNIDIKNFKYKYALIIGIMQGVAIIPGISRSGLTIATALILGIIPSLATKYSFLLSAPVIFGAFLLDLLKINKEMIKSMYSPELIVGMIVSYVVGIFAIKALIGILERNKLYYFSYYLWILGFTTIIYSLLRGVFVG